MFKTCSAVACLNLLAVSLSGQELARFTIRGYVNESQVNFFSGKQEAYVHVGDNTYSITCADYYIGCPGEMISSVGSCANLLGDAAVEYINPPYTVEYLNATLIGYPTTCGSLRERFTYIGHVTGYYAPPATATGYLEFDVSANGAVFHAVCDPLYLGCAAAIQSAVMSGRCVAVSGDLDMFILGFSGDTTLINWATFAQVFSRVEC